LLHRYGHLPSQWLELLLIPSEVPPVVTDGYKEKGQFSTVQNMKTYSTGSSSATTGILVV
jgi:hypothetical protein